MSVLKNKRHESKAEFVNVADQIFDETMWFLTRLSNRYQRLFCESTMKLASEVLDNSEKAQNIRIKDQVTFDARERHLIEAKASVMALDVHLSHIFSLIMLNPEGCFTDTKGRMKTEKEAVKILDNRAEELGSKIDHEKNMIEKLLESDRKKFCNS